ncbi:MAG TPA: hypothetical protein VFE47_25355 [Tepidisphaeraceae bacterium]|jgi:hypothetical protein|nr:hypothetical protein [Tepidisphaeraceae bacterium]
MSSYFWSSTSSTDPTVGANWTKSDGTTGAAPANGDDVYIQAIPGVVLANIAAADMSGVTLNSLTISQTFAGTIGTADTTSGAYFGYWKIGATTWTIGAPSADGITYSGSGRIKLNFGSAAFTGTVIATGSSADEGAEPVRIVGSNSASKLAVLGGRVGVATNLPGETATLGEVDLAGSGAICNLGPGVTWTTANVAGGGTLTLNSGSSGALSVASGASAFVQGPAAVATVNAGGNLTLNHRPASGAGITTLNLYPTGTADFSGNPAAITVSTVNHYRGGVISANPANPSHLTVTTRNLVNCGTLTSS